MKVFVSYSHKDARIVRNLINRLERYFRRHISFFIDHRHIIDNSNITKVLFEEGIARSQITIIFVSRNSINSVWVRYEFLLSEAFGRIIIPVVIEQLDSGELDIAGFLFKSKPINLKKVNFSITPLVKVLTKWLYRFIIYDMFSQFRTEYSFINEEDYFYELATLILTNSRYEDIIFKAGTPALLLKDEIYTERRAVYLDKLTHVFSKTSNPSRGIYTFDYSKTLRVLRSRDEQSIDFARRTVKKIDNSRLRIFGVRPASFTSLLPSTILGSKEGVLILRDPKREEFSGLIIVSGKELERVKTLYHILITDRKSVLEEDQWYGTIIGDE